MHDDDEKNKLEGADDDITNDAQLVSPAQYTSGFFRVVVGGGWCNKSLHRRQHKRNKAGSKNILWLGPYRVAFCCAIRHYMLDAKTL